MLKQLPFYLCALIIVAAMAACIGLGFGFLFQVANSLAWMLLLGGLPAPTFNRFLLVWLVASTAWFVWLLWRLHNLRTRFL